MTTMNTSFHRNLRTLCGLLGWLLVAPLLCAAQNTARKHLEQACWNLATQTMQVTECVQKGVSRTERLIMQRRLQDGTVERVAERLVDGECLNPEMLKIGQLLFRTYFTKDESVYLRIGRKSIRGIRRHCGIPLPKFRKECEITEENRIYEGRFCWNITVKNPTEKGTLVEQYLVSGSTQMLLVYRRFDVDGRLLMSMIYQNYDFSPQVPEGVFKLPEGAVIREERKSGNADDLRQEMIDEEKAEKAELYEQMNYRDLKSDLKYLCQGVIACFITMMTWAVVPVVLMVGVAFFVHHKVRRRTEPKRN